MTCPDVNNADCLCSTCPIYQNSLISFLLSPKKQQQQKNPLTFGAPHANHLDEQYGGNTNFWLPVAVCMCVHVFWLVCLKDQGHNLFILCPPASFDLTFECCTFCSSIVVSSHTEICAETAFGMFFMTLPRSFLVKVI